MAKQVGQAEWRGRMYLVERIVGKRIASREQAEETHGVEGGVEYLIKWLGHGTKKNSWCSVAQMKAARLVAQHEGVLAEKARKRADLEKARERKVLDALKAREKRELQRQAARAAERAAREAKKNKSKAKASTEAVSSGAAASRKRRAPTKFDCSDDEYEAMSLKIDSPNEFGSSDGEEFISARFDVRVNCIIIRTDIDTASDSDFHELDDELKCLEFGAPLLATTRSNAPQAAAASSSSSSASSRAVLTREINASMSVKALEAAVAAAAMRSIAEDDEHAEMESVALAQRRFLGERVGTRVRRPTEAAREMLDATLGGRAVSSSLSSSSSAAAGASAAVSGLAAAPHKRLKVTSSSSSGKFDASSSFMSQVAATVARVAAAKRRSMFITPAESVAAPATSSSAFSSSSSSSSSSTLSVTESVYPLALYPPSYVPLRVSRPAALASTRKQVLRVLQRSGESRDQLVARFHRTGVCYSRRGLSRAQAAQVAAQVTHFYNSCVTAIRALGLGQVLEDEGFTEFKLRQKGRYDLALPALKDEVAFPFLNREAPWLPLVRRILGPQCTLAHAGCMLSMPGSEAQPYHSDGPHLAKKYLPVHAVNVFVPLVDLRVQNGPTEFIPESHRDYNIPRRPVQFELDAGQCLVFDFRVKHRGMRNQSDMPRPVLYFTYAQPFWADEANFSHKRYREMPPLMQQLMAQSTGASAAPASALLPASSSSSSSFSSSSLSSSSASHANNSLSAMMDSKSSEEATRAALVAMRESRAQRRNAAADADSAIGAHSPSSSSSSSSSAAGARL